jgi:hypothetical protein
MQIKQKTIKKGITVGSGFLLMYTGLALLLLPTAMPTLLRSLTLSDTPKTFGFEDDLTRVSLIFGNPTAVSSPVANGKRAVECHNGDHLLWNLATPSRTMDLTFKVYWTKLPTVANESLNIAAIFGSEQGMWQSILTTTLYCDSKGYRGWTLWTDIPKGRGAFVSGSTVYALETNRWYTIRMTADLNTGTYRLHMDRTELAAITNATAPAEVEIDFFRVGVNAKGNSNFTTYYDDVTVSTLVPQPFPTQWALRITSSPGGSTNPHGTITADEGESLTATATPEAGYVFKNWILDGAEYSTTPTVGIPAQTTGTQHTLHAKFARPESTPDTAIDWQLILQATGLIMTGGGGYILWSQRKQESQQDKAQ